MTMAMNFTFKFDLLLACLFPLALSFVVLRTNAPNLRTWTWAKLRAFLTLQSSQTSAHMPFSLETAYHSYAHFSRLAGVEVTRRRFMYNTLPRAHKRIAEKIGYQAKLEKLKYATDMNATIVERVAELAAKEFGLADTGSGHAELGRVREALKHFVRDWSEEGAQEREKILRPVLNVLGAVGADERKGKRVLVPGAGLGRLAWEISQLGMCFYYNCYRLALNLRVGYDTTANELSFFMNLAFRFLLSPETTTSTNEHTLRPYSHWFSHQRSNDSLFRAVRFPDAIPRLSPTFRLAETDFLKISPPCTTPPTFMWSKSKSESKPADDHDQSGYDYIVTLFFIDTSFNVFTTMEHIHALLRPGGTWINLGPLLWTSGFRAQLELSLDEVVSAAEEIGFVFKDGDVDKGDVEARRTVECEYTSDGNAMMQWIYKAEFWVATKSK